MSGKQDFGEPWAIKENSCEDCIIVDKDGHPAVDAYCEFASEPAYLSGDIQRIVACVNACRGATQEDLEQCADSGGLKKLITEWHGIIKRANDHLRQATPVMLSGKSTDIDVSHGEKPEHAGQTYIAPDYKGLQGDESDE